MKRLNKIVTRELRLCWTSCQDRVSLEGLQVSFFKSLRYCSRQFVVGAEKVFIHWILLQTVKGPRALQVTRALSLLMTMGRSGKWFVHPPRPAPMMLLDPSGIPLDRRPGRSKFTRRTSVSWSMLWGLWVSPTPHRHREFPSRTQSPKGKFVTSSRGAELC